MESLQSATLQELVAEMENAKHALAVDSVLGLPRGQKRKWTAYLRAINAEINRREPAGKATDEELMRELADFA